MGSSSSPPRPLLPQSCAAACVPLPCRGWFAIGEPASLQLHHFPPLPPPPTIPPLCTLRRCGALVPDLWEFSVLFLKGICSPPVSLRRFTLALSSFFLLNCSLGQLSVLQVSSPGEHQQASPAFPRKATWNSKSSSSVSFSRPFGNRSARFVASRRLSTTPTTRLLLELQKTSIDQIGSFPRRSD